MSPRQILGLIGSIILFLGVFAPIVSVPIVGNMNYFQNGKGDGVFILLCAVSSFIFVLIKEFRGLWITGLFSIGFLAFTFINFHLKISDAKSEMDSALAGNPFRGLADLAIQSVQIQWGWALLIVGAGLVIASAAMKEERYKEKSLEQAKEVRPPLLSEVGELGPMAPHSKTQTTAKIMSDNLFSAVSTAFIIAVLAAVLFFSMTDILLELEDFIIPIIAFIVIIPIVFIFMKRFILKDNNNN